MIPSQANWPASMAAGRRRHQEQQQRRQQQQQQQQRALAVAVAVAYRIALDGIHERLHDVWVRHVHAAERQASAIEKVHRPVALASCA